MGTRCANHVTPLYPQKLALTSPTGGGRSIAMVRSRTKPRSLVYYYYYYYYYLSRPSLAGSRLFPRGRTGSGISPFSYLLYGCRLPIVYRGKVKGEVVTPPTPEFSRWVTRKGSGTRVGVFVKLSFGFSFWPGQPFWKRGRLQPEFYS